MRECGVYRRSERRSIVNDSPSEITFVTSEVVANALDVPIDELPPIRESVDTEALANVFHSSSQDQGAATIVSFSYAGTRVSIVEDGTVFVRPLNQ